MFGKILLTVVFTYHSTGFGRNLRVDLTGLSWAETLRSKKVKKINICGDGEIMNTEKSIRRDFIIGEPAVGYAFQQLIDSQAYWILQQSYRQAEAKKQLKKSFAKTKLWRVNAAGEAEDLGFPVRFKFDFTASVRDCLEGATSTIGHNCSANGKKSTPGCCQEKFVGFDVIWKRGKDQIKLRYAPDPSLKLKVAGERSFRYCHSIDTLSL